MATKKKRQSGEARAGNERHLGIVDALAQTSFLVQSTIKRIAQPHELSITQVRLLGILRDREPGVLALAEHLELDKSSVTGLVDRAERRGLVERIQRTDDGRAVAVKLTPAGRKLVALVEKEVDEALLEITAELSQGQRDQLSALLSRVVPAGA